MCLGLCVCVLIFLGMVIWTSWIYGFMCFTFVKLSSYMSYFSFSYFFCDSTYPYVISIDGVLYSWNLFPFFFLFVFNSGERIWLIYPTNILFRALPLSGDFRTDHLRSQSWVRSHSLSRHLQQCCMMWCMDAYSWFSQQGYQRQGNFW